jgi:hypothetical protein
MELKNSVRENIQGSMACSCEHALFIIYNSFNDIFSVTQIISRQMKG